MPLEKYRWSVLTNQQVGAYVEYFVKMELTMFGFQVYGTEVDDRGVDFIAQFHDGPFLKIQVKSVRGVIPETWRSFRCSQSPASS